MLSTLLNKQIIISLRWLEALGKMCCWKEIMLLLLRRLRKMILSIILRLIMYKFDMLNFFIYFTH